MKLIETLIGKKFIFPSNKENKKLLKLGHLKDITLDKVYAVKGLEDDNDIYFLDDVGERNYSGADFSSAGNIILTE